MAGGVWRTVILGLAVAGLALGYLGMEAVRTAGADVQAYAADMGAVGVGVVALWVAFSRLSRHFRDLESFSESLASARGRHAPPDGTGRDDELGRLAKAVAEQRARAAPDRSGDRLAAVLATLEEPVVVLDDVGRIQTANAAASSFLGVERGADVYDHLSRPELFRAIERAREVGHMVTAVLRRAQGAEVTVRVKDLGLQAGVALVFPARAPEPALTLTGDRTIMRPAARGPHLGDEEPLLTLPLVSLWVATTAPSPAEGHVVAVGTVRLAGPRVFRTLCLDLPVDPGLPIPEEATAAHGVTGALVEGARSFRDAWPVIAQALHGCVAVGCGVDAALDALARGCAESGLPEPDRPPTLDLGRLAAQLDPALEGAPLTRLAEAFATPDHHRTDPFAPALVQADLAAALLLRLTGQGVATHGEARRLTATSAAAPP